MDHDCYPLWFSLCYVYLWFNSCLLVLGLLTQQVMGDGKNCFVEADVNKFCGIWCVDNSDHKPSHQLTRQIVPLDAAYIFWLCDWLYSLPFQKLL